MTDSLRGVVNFNMKVQLAETNNHSGEVGGIIPSSWRVLTVLLNRIYDMDTGAIKIPELNVVIP